LRCIDGKGACQQKKPICKRQGLLCWGAGGRDDIAAKGCHVGIKKGAGNIPSPSLFGGGDDETRTRDLRRDRLIL